MIEPLGKDDGDGARACAAMMAASDPWHAFGRPFADCLGVVTDPWCETYVAREEGAIRGFVMINMHGALVGYLRLLVVAPDGRSQGLGSRLVAFAEERIFRESPNVFLCVSSFNRRARALYERLGYEQVGELRDHLVRGASEIVMRKSRGPIISASLPHPFLPGAE